MIISRVILKNWRNFKSVDVSLRPRMFVVGPNASGKSNFLDVFRFLRDIAKSGGGLQSALNSRGGLSKIRCLSARKSPDIEIEVYLTDGKNSATLWRYAIGIKQQGRGHRRQQLSYERVWRGEDLILNRPDEHDQTDELRLTQTFLEQIIANEAFRDVAAFFDAIAYRHLIPQLIRYNETFKGSELPDDPFGQIFLDHIAQTPERTRNARLKKIESALQKAVPQLKNLSLIRDDLGVPHLEITYQHWRRAGAKQREDQFSDGTLRLIGLLWMFLEGDSLLLLEEPELSLNSGIVERIPRLMHRLLKHQKKQRQVILSTHSYELLSDKGIGGEEVLMLIPSAEGTEIKCANDNQDIHRLLSGGLSPAEAIVPYTIPENIQQLELFR
ncbi:MAG: chromosome segregation protein SMC [Gemmatimonadetes bacterium]|nr:MAG: chromosome segregation protein SMC [Gemmatimonadota bacterium]